MKSILRSVRLQPDFFEEAAPITLRLPTGRDRAKISDSKMKPQLVSRDMPLRGRDLISLAQKLARDAERHALLSASLASQADRLMVAGLRLLDVPHVASPKDAPRPRVS